jgi:hypothetical protein
MRFHRHLVAIVLGLAACREPSTGPEATATTAEITRDENAQFQTDSLAYTLGTASIGYVGVIGVTFVNRTGATVYFVNCGGATGLSLEKRVDGQWVNVWSPVMLLCLSPPIIVAAGATYRTQISIFGGYPDGNTYPRFSVADIAGEYRAVWYSVLRTYQESSSSFGEQLPLDARISNRFSIAVQPR